MHYITNKALEMSSVAGHPLSDGILPEYTHDPQGCCKKQAVRAEPSPGRKHCSNSVHTLEVAEDLSAAFDTATAH